MGGLVKMGKISLSWWVFAFGGFGAVGFTLAVSLLVLFFLSGLR